MLVDFGSVRQIFLDAAEEGSTVAGTYGYMPYEQYMGQASPASDLFAVGATFLHLLTARPPREFMDADGQIALPASLPGDPRLKRFLEEGRPATGRILRFDSEETAFLEKVARVHYEFEADGARHRDSDRVLPLMAGRWELHDSVSIPYIPGNPYDSVIVGGH